MSSKTIIEAPDATAIRGEYQSVVQAAETHRISDKLTHEAGLVMLKSLAECERKVREKIDPIIETAHRTHKALTTLRSDLLRPIGEAREAIARKLTSYEHAERLKAEAEEARLRDLAQKQEEERQIMDAVFAEAMGDAAVAEQILEQPVTTPVVHVAPEIAKIDGVVTRTTWRAEVVDKLAFVKWIVEHPEWLGLVDVVAAGINALARSQRERLAVPGLKAVKEESKAVRA